MEFEHDERGYGIYATSSQFTAGRICIAGSNPCTQYRVNNFDNLYYGIYTISTGLSDICYINYNNFNSYRGIYISGISSPEIVSNNFNIPGAISTPWEYSESYGLYLNESTAYHVEGNTFESNSDDICYGIYVNNSGTDDNEIYRNTFDGTYYGIAVQGVNRNGSIGGLCIKCNDFDDTKYDVFVTSGQINPGSNSGIAYSQGSNSTAAEDMAGNLFYYNTNYQYDDLDNETNFFFYYYPSNSDIGYDITEPIDYTSATVQPDDITIPLNDWTFEDGCPPTTGGSGGDTKEELRGNMAGAGAQADSVAAVLALLVDGGDTEALAEEVDESLPPEALQTYNQLMAESPYLSDTVMETVIDKEEVLPNAMVRDVLVANPQSAKSDVLLDKLDERDVPPPAYMKAQVLQGRSILSQKESTESVLTKYQQKQSQSFYKLSRLLAADTLYPSSISDSLITLYAADNRLSSKYNQAFLHLAQEEYEAGESVLDDIPDNYVLNSEETSQHQSLVAYYQLIADTIQVDSAKLQDVWELYNTGTGLSVTYARNYLITSNELEYNEPLLEPDQLKTADVQQSYEDLLGEIAPSKLKIIPNPANDYIIIAWQFEIQTEAEVEIHDMNGRGLKDMEINEVSGQEIIDVSTWLPGVYIVSLKIKGKLTESVKFTIVP